ncbi:MAG: BMP family ABC transporter substrate-binding protein, partial [Clostridia bacterium]|nr:BMP family ABC transporter substrate-binding protein [Clostridia bacterium]
MKKLVAVLLALVLCLSATAALAEGLKVGYILIGDETEGYTYAHIKGYTDALEAMGLPVETVIPKYKVEESSVALEAAEDLFDQGCNLIISNSYGHQDYMAEAAAEFEDEDVTFVSMTGDYAAISGLSNFHNAFTKVYESRYVSGVVAGMKVAELIASGELSAETQPNSFDENGNVKIGYVGAYPYAEVVSGFTAFFLGIRSVYPEVVMEVTYTNAWFDISAEAAAAEALVANGCVIIGQHADSTGAPSAIQKLLDAGNICYSVGYNVDMLNVAPTAALPSPTNEWAASDYYLF